MTSALSMEADHIATAGHEAGEHLWSAVEALVKAGLRSRHALIAFDCALEQLVEALDGGEDASLFQASARLAIPIVALSAAQRSEIRRDMDSARAAFIESKKEAA